MKKITKLLCLIFISPILSASAACSFSLEPINFGNYNPFLTNDTISSARVQVICNNFSAYTLKFRTSISGNAQYRFMSNLSYLNQTTQLQYGLFSDNTRNSVWGDGTNGTTIYKNITWPFIPQNTTVYGKIYKLQNIYKGNYGEVVIMDIDY